MSEPNSVYGEMIKSVTKESDEVVNNTVKSILSRINSAPVAKAILNLYKVDVRDNAITTLENLSNSWKGFSDEEKKEISEGVAGRYQMSRMIILMGEMSK